VSLPSRSVTGHDEGHDSGPVEDRCKSCGMGGASIWMLILKKKTKNKRACSA
jgi:hypothetical protein